MSERITADDRPSVAFVQVTPGLVRKVGAVGALVWARIDWRTNEDSFAAIDPDKNGERWWTANVATISEETGLTFSQVKNAVVALERAGHIESRQLDKVKWSRVKSYRTRISASSEIGRSNSANLDVLDRPDLDDLPLRNSRQVNTGKPQLTQRRPSSSRLASEAQLVLLRDAHIFVNLEVPDDEQMAGYAALTRFEADEEYKSLWPDIEHGGDLLLEEVFRDFGSELSPAAVAFIEKRLGSRVTS